MDGENYYLIIYYFFQKFKSILAGNEIAKKEILYITLEMSAQQGSF